MTSVSTMDESTVARLWERQAFDPVTFLTHGLRIVFRGTPSDAGGPDYQDALVEVSDGRLSAGDVEFHVLASDWYRHGHHLNHAYDRVIVHVVWTDDTGPVQRADGQTAPTVGLDRDTLASRRGLPEAGTANLIPHSCAQALARLPIGRVEAGVRRAALVRFRRLAERFDHERAVLGDDEVLYRSLLESLGYASNRAAFRALAEAVPFGWLVGLPHALWADALLTAAGLPATREVDVPARVPGNLWRLERLRPTNHPVKRIVGAAHVLSRLSPQPAAALCRAIVAEPERRAVRSLATVAGPRGAIGAGRADEICVSVFLPFVASFHDVSAVAERLFLEYYQPQPTRWTRAMRRLLLDAGHPSLAPTASTHQGLHHLYTTHCRYDRSRDCPLCASIRDDKGLHVVPVSSDFHLDLKRHP